MNPLTYLGFTIFSIIMQFCVMEFIHERLHFDKDSAMLNESFDINNDPIEDIKRKPHALFYRTETDKIILDTYKDGEPTKYSDTSPPDTTLTSTDVSSTTYEVYYENTSTMEDYFTINPYSTTSEFDNVTEITFLDKNGTTAATPSGRERTSSENDCFCNLSYQKCDINCCCDVDCTEHERGLFMNCAGAGAGAGAGGGARSRAPACDRVTSVDVFGGLWCVVRVNSPDRRIQSNVQLDVAAVNTTFKWHNINKPDVRLHYETNKYGNPLWLVTNGAVLPLSLPAAATNYYCNGRKQILFLVNEDVRCYVKLRDLYASPAVGALAGTRLLSVTDPSTDATVPTCSTSHCTNWTILACEDNACVEYDASAHAPRALGGSFRNVVHAMEYTFYYFHSKITNATLKMYLSTIRMNLPLLMQKTTVEWYLGDESAEGVIRLSGTPGYVPGLPMVVSSAASDHTLHFYNRTYGSSFLPLPRNDNGRCKWLNSKSNPMLFGSNARLKCRLLFDSNIAQNILQKNASRACLAIQTSIEERSRLNRPLFVSPYGDPRDVSDGEWVPVHVDGRAAPRGELRSDNSELACYDMVTRYAFVIVYVDAGGGRGAERNKIVSAGASAIRADVTFDSTDPSTVLTIDVRFIDGSGPAPEFGRAPNLNIRLPESFFLDYPSNLCDRRAGDVVVLLHSLVLLVMK